MREMTWGRREKTRGIEKIFGLDRRAEAGAVGAAVRNGASFVGFLSKRRIEKHFRLRWGGYLEGPVRRDRSELLLGEAVNDAARSFCIVANWTGACALVWRCLGSWHARLAR